jgi:hypothetical protein
MTQTATEQQGQQSGNGDQGQQGSGQQQAGGDQGQNDDQARQQQGQGNEGQQGNGAGHGGSQQGQQNGQGNGQQQSDDGLTDEERNALSDPGKRALERVRGERDTARTENETLRSQLTEALAKVNEGTDAAVQQQITEATTARETAERATMSLQAVLRAGLAVPRENETGAQFAERMTQLAGLLQGADQAALDASAAVLASLGTGQGNGQQRQQSARNSDTQSGGQGQGQAGEMSMDQLIRHQAGRTVQRG